jgi:hypothetical protein
MEKGRTWEPARDGPRRLTAGVDAIPDRGAGAGARRAGSTASPAPATWATHTHAWPDESGAR